jgi:hypothetical protein
MDNILMQDLDRHTAAIRAAGEWLDQVYYHPEFASVGNRPVLSMLKTATIYLADNLDVLKAHFIARSEE